jgi:hypothetical protein
MTAWNDDSHDLLDELIRRLEQAWQAGRTVDLGQFVPAVGDPARRQVLLALIPADQELRWQHDQHKSVEEYLAKWPELRAQPDCVASGRRGALHRAGLVA